MKLNGAKVHARIMGFFGKPHLAVGQVSQSSVLLATQKTFKSDETNTLSGSK
jgi:hypothetical protein